MDLVGHSTYDTLVRSWDTLGVSEKACSACNSEVGPAGKIGAPAPDNSPTHFHRVQFHGKIDDCTTTGKKPSSVVKQQHKLILIFCFFATISE
jgi:hypothetical protein